MGQRNRPVFSGDKAVDKVHPYDEEWDVCSIENFGRDKSLRNFRQ